MGWCCAYLLLQVSLKEGYLFLQNVFDNENKNSATVVDRFHILVENLFVMGLEC